jgi:hypothetical protein
MAILIVMVAIAGLYGLWRFVRDELDREIQSRWGHEAPCGGRAAKRGAMAARVSNRREMYGAPQPHST